MTETITASQVVDAVCRASQQLIDQRDYLTSLDQAMGDGDMGITMGRIGEALQEHCRTSGGTAAEDLGKYLFALGTTTNKAAPSTMGTLTAGALMSMGKTVKGKTELQPADLVAMFQAADEGIQTRGKAKLGDKTIVDALHPASEAFTKAIDAGASLQDAGAAALQAAAAGRDSVTPLRSKVGRASWVGERTEGKVDGGCAMLVLVLEALTK